LAFGGYRTIRHQDTSAALPKCPDFGRAAEVFGQRFGVFYGTTIA